MQIVVADTGPVNYLVLIRHIDLLPVLFERVILPDAVRAELADPNAPREVRAWVVKLPPWMEVHATPVGYFDLNPMPGIHKGEKAAIALAAVLSADVLLMDDRKGVIAAERKGLRVTGTLGVLDLAAERGLVDFRQAITELERTNFRRPEAVLNSLLKKHAR